MTTYKGTIYSSPPTMAPMGEIVYPDGHRVLVPQPVKFEAIPARMCMSCLRTKCPPDCPDRVALDGGLSVTGVMRAIDEAPEMPTEARSPVPRVPVWALACIVSGLVLVAIGLVLRDPVARVVWEAIPR